jgi:hypothetical protein
VAPVSVLLKVGWLKKRQNKRKPHRNISVVSSIFNTRKRERIATTKVLPKMPDNCGDAMGNRPSSSPFFLLAGSFFS